MESIDGILTWNYEYSRPVGSIHLEDREVIALLEDGICLVINPIFESLVGRGGIDAGWGLKALTLNPLPAHQAEPMAPFVCKHDNLMALVLAYEESHG